MNIDYNKHKAFFYIVRTDARLSSLNYGRTMDYGMDLQNIRYIVYTQSEGEARREMLHVENVVKLYFVCWICLLCGRQGLHWMWFAYIERFTHPFSMHTYALVEARRYIRSFAFAENILSHIYSLSSVSGALYTDTHTHIDNTQKVLTTYYRERIAHKYQKYIIYCYTFCSIFTLNVYLN